MRSLSRKKFAALAAAALVALVAGMLIVTSKDVRGQDQPKAPAAGDVGRNGRAGVRRMMMMMPGMMGGSAAIAVADGKVFVVQGGTLYKFDAETLELEGQNTFIERPMPGAMGMGGGGFAGRRPGAGGPPRLAPEAPPK